MTVSKTITGFLHISEDYYVFARIGATKESSWTGTQIASWLDDKAFDGRKVKLTIEVMEVKEC